METKICVSCGLEKPLDKFGKSFEGCQETYNKDTDNPSSYKSKCKACYAKKDRAKLKLDALNALGCRCNCCGEDDYRFLSLDHVNSDGNIHRELLNEQQIYREARREGFPKNKYQILCISCNWARAYYKGICPHKSGITKDDAFKNLVLVASGTARKFVNENKTGLELGPLAKMLKTFSKEQIEEMLKKLK